LAIIEKGNRELANKLQELRFRPDKRLELEQRVEAYKAEKRAIEDNDDYRNIIQENVAGVSHFIPTLAHQLRIERFLQLHERWIIVRENKKKQDELFLSHKRHLLEESSRRREEFLAREQERAESEAKRQKYMVFALAISLSARKQAIADAILNERRRRLHHQRMWWSVRKIQRNLRKQWAERAANRRIEAVLAIQRFVKKQVMMTAVSRRRKTAATLKQFLEDNESANKVKVTIQNFIVSCKKLQAYFKKSFSALCSRRVLMEMQWEKWENKMVRRYEERARRSTIVLNGPPLVDAKGAAARGPAGKHPKPSMIKGKMEMPQKPPPPMKGKRGVSVIAPGGGPMVGGAGPRTSIMQGAINSQGQFQTIPKNIKEALVILRIKRNRAEYMKKYDEWSKEMKVFQEQWDKESNMRQAKALMTQKGMNDSEKKKAEEDAWKAAAPNGGKQPRWSPLLLPHELPELHEWGLKQLGSEAKEAEENEAAAAELFAAHDRNKAMEKAHTK